MTISRTEAEALAALVARLRASHNMTAWDHPGIMAAIEKARAMADAFDLAHALLVLAERPDLRTPALLSTTGEHWRRMDGTMTKRHGDNDIPCPEHTGQTMPCPKCRDAVRPPTPDELAEIREAYQAKVRELREERAEIEKRRAEA
ncbi:MAG TPA: hypothetical protein GX718_01515 [Brevibacterium sp.]|nr:hypothetical protein [Brevibacterium sp.]